MNFQNSASPGGTAIGAINMRRITVLLGIPVDNLTMSEAINRLAEMVYAGRATHRSHQVVTINTDFLVTALRDADLRRILQHAHLATADGMPLLWAARLLKAPLPQRIAGADMVPALAQRAAQEGFSLYLLGAAPGVAASTAQILRSRCPGLKIAGIASPQIPTIESTPAEVLNDIRAAHPDILLVALGNPKQEKWIDYYAAQLGVPVIIGVGGTFDLIAGRLTRAPGWMQKWGLEWLYRLLQEPGRLWKRYASDLLIFPPLLIRQMIAMQPPIHTDLLPSTELLLLQETSIIHLNGQLTVNNSETFRRWSQVALDASPYLIINLAELDFLDSSAIGLLVDLARQTRARGGQLWLAGLRPSILATLHLLKLDTFFEIRPDIIDCLAERRTQIHTRSIYPSTNGRKHNDHPTGSSQQPGIPGNTRKTVH